MGKADEVPTPAGVGRWSPLSHITLVNELEHAITPYNMRIVNETFKLDADGHRMFGMLQIANCKPDTDVAYAVGLRNAHDKKISAGLVVGMGVAVCSNLSFKGEIKIGRKHTLEIHNDLPILMKGAIAELSKKWDIQDQTVSRYKQVDISVSQGHDILINCAKQDVFPKSRLMDVIEEFESPRHPEFKDRNLWSLFNSVTELLKPRQESTGGTLWLLPNRTEALHHICDNVAGLSLN